MLFCVQSGQLKHYLQTHTKKRTLQFLNCIKFKHLFWNFWVLKFPFLFSLYFFPPLWDFSFFLSFCRSSISLSVLLCSASSLCFKLDYFYWLSHTCVVCVVFISILLTFLCSLLIPVFSKATAFITWDGVSDKLTCSSTVKCIRFLKLQRSV